MKLLIFVVLVFTLSSLNDDASLITTLNNAFDNCFSKADTKAAQFQEANELKPAFDGEKICHPISGYVLNCIVNEMFISCPTNIWKSNSKCNDIKDYVMRCKTIPRKPYTRCLVRTEFLHVPCYVHDINI